MNKRYKALLSDPRWQKKRLEVFERDNWRCERCGNGEEQLHVHHKEYWPNTDPWDYPNHILSTFCKSCHETEHNRRERRSWFPLPTVETEEIEYTTIENGIRLTGYILPGGGKQ